MNRDAFYDSICQLIEVSRNVYQVNPRRIVADYNNEKATTKEYNGRQVLELLQNADDAGSSEVFIKLDTDAKLFTIANKGQAFTLEGIESIMLAHYSSKVSNQYIGNKGLGFRSILNWANNIRIKSHGLFICFSPQIAEREFQNLQVSLEQKEEILKARGFAKDTIPFPTLAIPDVTLAPGPPEDWVTSIEIEYKNEFEADIIEQVASFKPEVLLFLNNIQYVRIETKEHPVLEFSSKKKENSTIEIGERTWTIVSAEGELPEGLQDKTKTERQRYSIKLAYQEDLSDTYYKLFNYFPTSLNIYLPCIIHGTFDVNSSRNYLNPSKQNEFILNEVIKLLNTTALLVAKKKVDWAPFRLMYPLQTATDSTLIAKFYEELRKSRGLFEIYPTIGGEYKTLSKAHYYTNEFSAFIHQVDQTAVFSELMLPLDQSLVEKVAFKPTPFASESFQQLVSQLSRRSFKTVGERVRFIKFLISKEFECHKGGRYDVLTNKDGEVISARKTAFTPVTGNRESFDLPDFVKIDFIDRALYEELCEQLEVKDSKQRELQRQLRDITNIQPYEPNPVIERIITHSRDALEYLEGKEKQDILQEMVQALYLNYTLLDTKSTKVSVKVPLVNKVGEVVNSEELFLSKDYPTGKFTEEIYKGIYGDDKYLNDASFWGLDKDNPLLVEEFFVWLGVNRLAIHESIDIENKWSLGGYFSYVFEAGFCSKPDSFEVSRITKLDMQKVANLEDIQKLSPTKLVLLTLKDNLIRRCLEHQDTDGVTWFYVKAQPSFVNLPSYIRFQLQQLPAFKYYVLEEESSEVLQFLGVNNPVDYDYLAAYGFKKREVDSILLKIGAKETFDDLDVETITCYLNKLAQIPIDTTAPLDAHSKFAQKLYKLTIAYFDKNKAALGVQKQSALKLFARRQGVHDYVANNDVYYSDNNTLPKRIIDKLWILNFPKRQGEEKIASVFSINTFKDFLETFRIHSSTLHHIQDKFEQFFDSIKPFVLAYRISSLRSQADKRAAASQLKGCTINVVSACSYRENEESPVEIEVNEFINEKNTFYVKARGGYRLVEQLQKDSAFCDAIAEILCIVFKINDLKNDFRAAFKNDFSDTLHLIKEDLGEDVLKEVQTLLGISTSESLFWKAIFDIKGKLFPEYLSSLGELEQQVRVALGVQLPEHYKKVDFERLDSKEGARLLNYLCPQLDITLSQLKEAYSAFQGLHNWHRGRLKQEAYSLEKKFEGVLWNTLLIRGPQAQASFVITRNRYHTWFEEQTWSELVPFVLALDAPYKELLCLALNSAFGIDMYKEHEEPQQVINLYPHLFLDPELEQSLTLEEKSLLYFPANDKAVQEILHKYRDEGEIEEAEEATAVLPIQLSSIATNARQGLKQYFGGRDGAAPLVHNIKKEKTQKKAGKKAEKAVRDALVKHYGSSNVQWISGNSDESYKNDKAGYDIRYRESATADWSFLEVKSASTGMFVMSNNEMITALREKEHYHLAIVKDGTIHLVKDFFVNEQLAKEFNLLNSSTLIHPHDYEIEFAMQCCGETFIDESMLKVTGQEEVLLEAGRL